MVRRTRPGISRFRVRAYASPRNDDTSLRQILLHLLAQPVAQIGARHAERDIGAQEACFRAAIVALAFELDAVEGLGPGQTDHGVGELDLAAGAALLRFQDLEDFRCLLYTSPSPRD